MEEYFQQSDKEKKDLEVFLNEQLGFFKQNETKLVGAYEGSLFYFGLGTSDGFFGIFSTSR